MKRTSKELRFSAMILILFLTRNDCKTFIRDALRIQAIYPFSSLTESKDKDEGKEMLYDQKNTLIY